MNRTAWLSEWHTDEEWLEALHKMRAQRAAMLNPQGAAKLGLATDEETRSKTVINAEHSNFLFWTDSNMSGGTVVVLWPYGWDKE